jgi:methionyl-tRNA synthetase
VRIAAVLLLPVMPSSCAEMLRRMGDRTPAGDIRLERDARWRREGARAIVKGPALWPRSDERVKETTVDEKPISAVPTMATAPQAVDSPAASSEDARISMDDFMKVELRVARVLTAEAVPKSRKLIKLTIDAGTEQRTLVAGIAEAYSPEQLVGRTVVIVANLKPATLMGIESNGMVLAASVDGGTPSLVSVDSAVSPGTRVR